MCNVADKFGVFVYFLIVCCLGMLAHSLFRILMLVNLAMHKVAWNFVRSKYFSCFVPIYGCYATAACSPVLCRPSRIT